MFGIVLPKEYRYITFKGVRSLAKLDPIKLKASVERIKKNSLNKNEVILNTNLPK